MNRLSRFAPPLTLAVLTPIIAEYLLGDLTLAQWPALPVLVLMYGMGALLVREAVRRLPPGGPADPRATPPR